MDEEPHICGHQYKPGKVKVERNEKEKKSESGKDIIGLAQMRNHTSMHTWESESGKNEKEKREQKVKVKVEKT